MLAKSVHFRIQIFDESPLFRVVEISVRSDESYLFNRNRRKDSEYIELQG